jgi:hypothetical protein
MVIKHVHGKTMSSNGCKVEIDGDVIYSLIPPRITGFRGSVHISGASDCPNGDLHFGTETNNRTTLGMPVGKFKRK